MSSQESDGAEESEPRKAGHARMRTDGEGPSPLERWDQRYPANAQAVHGECTVELEKWEQTLPGGPWRMTKGAAPCAVKVACTVLNGGDEETYHKATRLVPTQLECALFHRFMASSTCQRQRYLAA